MASITITVNPPAGWRVFPDLPGLEYPLKRTARWARREYKSASGRSLRSTYWSWPVWEFSLSFEFLRDGYGYDEMQQLVAFFNSRYGPTVEFLFRDDAGFLLADQTFGVGDGVRTQFALTRTVGGISEPVGAAIVQQIKVAAAATTAFTLLNDRVIQFNVAPALGAQLKWSGYYWLRCVFSDESLTFEKFTSWLHSSKTVKIETVKF
jgi:hypothetical protein